MIYRAVVADVRDPADRGRIKVMIPALSGTAKGEWVWPVVSAGYVVTPDVGDQVWVVFENGDKETPVWLGATQDAPGYRTLLERVVALEERVTALEGA